MAEEPELCYLRALASELNLQRKNGTHCDCHVVVQGSTFKAHRNVLFAASPHVRALLRGQAERPGQVVVIHLDIVTAAGFAAILDYMYSGRVILSSRNMIEVMSAASYLQMTELVRLCDHYIRTSFKVRAHRSTQTRRYTGTQACACIFMHGAGGGHASHGTACASPSIRPPTPPTTMRASTVRGEPGGGREETAWTSPNMPADSSDEDDYGEEAAPDYDDPTVDYDGSAPDYDDGAAPPDYDDGAPPLHGYGDVDGMDVSGMAVPLDGGVGDEEEEDGGEDGEEGDGAGAHAGHAGGSPGCFTYTILTENLTAAGEGGGTGRMFGKRRLLQCNYCNFAAMRKYKLVRHIRTHTGERPFGCDACGKRFIRREHLQRHTQVHQKERRFVCRRCRRLFVFANSVGIEFGTRRYGVCEECS
ncbi:unnamed protein product, partial [Lampetra fluviatilis]